MKTTGQSIKEQRLKKGLTQKELAENSGVSLRALSNYEKDLRDPALDVILKLCHTLDIPIAVLAKDTDLLNKISINHDSTIVEKLVNHDIAKIEKHVCDNAKTGLSNIFKYALVANREDKDKQYLDLYSNLTESDKDIMLEMVSNLVMSFLKLKENNE